MKGGLWQRLGTTFHSLQVQSDQEQEETSHSGGSLKIQPGDFDQCEKDLRTRLFLLQPCRLSDGKSSDCCESEDGSDGNY